MRLKLITPPTAEPVGLDLAKLHLRVDATAEDTLLAGYLAAAREFVERVCGWALMTQTWDLYLDAFPEETELALPRSPLASVTGVYYTALAAVEATYSSASYTVDTASTPGRIVLNDGYSWPADTLVITNGVRVRFVAGYANADLVPAHVVQTLLLLLGMLYETRELGGDAMNLVTRLLPDRDIPV
jgi:uncharacterized phiE125 gp8 family phage protein